MKQSETTNLALFIDFDNVALGARDARQRFDIHLVLQRLLEKGKIIVKRAYADWSHHKEYLTDLHQAGIELIEIPAPGLSGKNSADIRLVVDAMDLCYGKEHLDTFIIVSGDSDFSPLVSKLRENGKAVIGVGVRNSSSHLLIVNCDEFIFYDDIYADRVSRQVDGLAQLPDDKRKLFGFLIETIQGLMRETKGVLHASLVKDTMKRKQPEFNEHKHGYSTFGDLLEEAMQQGLLEAQRDSRAGGTWVVVSLGKSVPRGDGARRGTGRSSRRRNGRGRRGENGAGAPDVHGAEAVNGRAETAPEGAAPPAPSHASGEGASVEAPEAGGSRRSRGRRRGRRKDGAAGEAASNGAAPAEGGAPKGAAGGETAGRPAAGPSRPAIVAFPAQDTAAPAPAASGPTGRAERGEGGGGGEGEPVAAGKAQERAKSRRRPARKPAAGAAAADEAAPARKRPARGSQAASRPAGRAPRASGDDDGSAARKPVRRRRSPAGNRKEED